MKEQTGLPCQKLYLFILLKIGVIDKMIKIVILSMPHLPHVGLQRQVFNCRNR